MLARVGYKQYRFQSTLPREERHSIGSHGANSWYFNPRSHERSDDNELTTLDAVERISIHAPTRGATKGFHFMLFVLCNFNPRSHERSDYINAVIL